MKSFSSSIKERLLKGLSFLGFVFLFFAFQNCGQGPQSGMQNSATNTTTTTTTPPSTDTNTNICTSAEVSQLETDMTTILNNATPDQGADENFSISITSSDNRSFTFSRNNIYGSTYNGVSIGTNSAQMLSTSEIKSASTAKTVSASLIMDLVTNPSLQVAYPGPHCLSAAW